MYFSAKQIEQTRVGLAELRPKYHQLVERFVARDYRHGRAEEFAKQGFARRLGTLTRCIEQVFALIPPDTEGTPDLERRTDAEICIQSFVSNIFGGIDNLAWMLVEEKALTEDDGRPIRSNWIGLRPSNAYVRGKLSTQFRQYLGTLDLWFAYLENYRHALAHRIPLYIPPCVQTPDHQHGVFCPLIMHSYQEEGVHPYFFHFQMFADFNTLEEIALNVLDELDR